jgi:hypothetical protein
VPKKNGFSPVGSAGVAHMGSFPIFLLPCIGSDVRMLTVAPRFGLAPRCPIPPVRSTGRAHGPRTQAVDSRIEGLMTIKRRKAGHPAARAKRRLRPAALKVARARSSDAGDITSKPMLIGYARVSTVDQNLAFRIYARAWRAGMFAARRGSAPVCPKPPDPCGRLAVPTSKRRASGSCCAPGSLTDALGIPDRECLRPPRLPVAAPVPSIMPAAALAEAESAAAGGAGAADPKSLEAGWHIYVELATRIATQDLAAGTGLIAEAIASLYALSGEIRKELKSVPPLGSGGRADSIEGLGLRILNEGLRPFLAKWHPRYERFKGSSRPGRAIRGHASGW